ncbi:hypothetical protein [Actinomadura rubrisoli]|uniref:Uncharacterized protein n=1 Tax=Actinomadura rubrisoli TaxID=2530368 RepID=A0A4V6PF55_9ACTN|nr:hypothetical protein [Actinomadura rubrisoli]TDD92507.1 hypothetical protein E1298_10845 [Actinomadura rubrisoli]
MIVTIDELRALRRIAYLSLPSFVTAGDTGDLAVDAAAIRGLAARDLVALPEAEPLDGVRVAGGLRRLLGPCASPRTLAEIVIEREPGGRTARYSVAAGDAPPVTLLTALPAGLGSVELLDTDAGTLLPRLCGLDEGAAATPSRVTLSVAHRLGEGGPDGRFAAGELRWLIACDGTTALLTEPAGVAESATAVGEADGATVPVDVGSLRRDVRELIEGKAVEL